MSKMPTPKVVGATVSVTKAGALVVLDLSDGDYVRLHVGDELPERPDLVTRLRRVDEALARGRDPRAFAPGTRARAVADLRGFSERVRTTVAPRLADLAELAAAVEGMAAG